MSGTKNRHLALLPVMNELILVVDDEPKIVKLARDYLENGGFRVLTAANGVDVLPITRQERPDLVVLDLNLPGMDGLGATEEIRKWEENIYKKAGGCLNTDFRLPATSDRVPIIALTAHAMRGDMEKCIDSGMDDYITKPIHLKLALDTIKKWISKGGQIGF